MEINLDFIIFSKTTNLKIFTLSSTFTDQRLKDLDFWKKELDTKLDDLHKEIDYLEAFKIRVNKALEAFRDYLEIAKQCLVNRFVVLSFLRMFQWYTFAESL